MCTSTWFNVKEWKEWHCQLSTILLRKLYREAFDQALENLYIMPVSKLTIYARFHITVHVQMSNIILFAVQGYATNAPEKVLQRWEWSCSHWGRQRWTLTKGSHRDEHLHTLRSGRGDTGHPVERPILLTVHERGCGHITCSRSETKEKKKLLCK